MNLKDIILNADDLAKPRAEEVPEWGCTVYIKQATCAQVERMGRMAMDKTPNSIASSVAMVLCDVDGNRIFKDADAIKLGGKNFDIVERLYNIIDEMNKISEEEDTEIKNV